MIKRKLDSETLDWMEQEKLILERLGFTPKRDLWDRKDHRIEEVDLDEFVENLIETWKEGRK